MRYDVIIIGGGIIGTCVAWQLKQRFPGKHILLLEKENQLATHQTGRNSGVIHAGVYYEPDSLKARFCREGNAATIAFCKAHRIPYEVCGKLLVATSASEQSRMLRLYERAQINSMDPQWLNARQLKRKEPQVNGVGAFLVRSTGIVDYGQVTNKMAEIFASMGGEVKFGAGVLDLTENDDELQIDTATGRLRGRYLVACAGLMADRVVDMIGIKRHFQIIPFRGEYYQLPEEKNQLIKHLIYPIPDPSLPFLGIHLTRMVSGAVTVGPNAVLALKREGYVKTAIDLRDLVEMARWRGFWHVLRKNALSGLLEYKNSLLKRGYLTEVNKYCPQLKITDLRPYPAGVRAQAVARDGTLIHDFLLAETKRSVHVCNAPSPAATSSIPIATHIIDRLQNRFSRNSSDN